MTTRICNKCGKVLSSYDDFKLNYRFGYGSKNDNDEIDLDLCNECLDKLIGWLRQQCKHDIIVQNG